MRTPNEILHEKRKRKKNMNGSFDGACSVQLELF